MEYELVDAEWVDTMSIPDEIKDIPVTSVAAKAFVGRIDLEKVTFGVNIKLVGKESFKDCSSLKDIVFSSTLLTENDEANQLNIGQDAFNGALLDGDLLLPEKIILNQRCFYNSQLKKVEFKGNFSVSGGSQFGYCSALTEVKFSQEGALASSMFLMCKSLLSVNLPENTTKIPMTCFRGCEQLKYITNAENVRTIQEGGFRETGLTEFDLTNVISLTESAFKGTKLGHIIINPALVVEDRAHNAISLNYVFDMEYVKRIDYLSMDKMYSVLPGANNSNVGGFDVFIDGELLTEITTPTSLTTIEKLGCIKSLKTLTIPNNPRECTMGAYAFSGCENLESVSIGAGKMNFDTSGNQFARCKRLNRFELSSNNSCESLPQSFFENSGELKQLSIPHITSLGAYCFRGSLVLSIDLPAVTQINSWCFGNCTSLRTLNLPSLLYFSNYEFENCELIEELNFPEVTSIGGIYYNFGTNSSLRKLSLPKLQTIKVLVPSSLEEAEFDTATELLYFGGGSSNWEEQYKLTSLKMPMVSVTGQNYARGGTLSVFKNLTELSMPMLEELCFDLPPNIVSADFPKVTKVTYGSINLPSLEHLNMPELRVIDSNFASGNILSELNLDKLEYMNSMAFNRSQNLKEVRLPNIIYFNGFSESPTLETIVLGENTKTIIVSNLPALKTFEVFGNLEKINMGDCFSGEGSKLIFHGNVDVLMPCRRNKVDEIIFEGDLGVAQGDAFYKTEARSITFMGNVGKFERNSFSNVTGVKKVKLGNLESWISCECENYGFPDNSNEGIDFYLVNDGTETLIENLIIPSGYGVRPYAFYKSSVKNVVIEPSEIKNEIGFGAFQYCSQLDTIEIGDGITAIGSWAFGFSSVKDVRMASSVSILGGCAFSNCYSLRNITLSPNIPEISTMAMYNCTSLNYVIFPEGVKRMSDEVLNCREAHTKLISLPSTLETLQDNLSYPAPTFISLTPETEIYCWAVNPPNAPLEKFQDVTIHVPASSLDNYKQNIQWSKANLIGDLFTEQEVSSDGTSVIITIPDNSVNDVLKIDQYKVTCCELDDQGNCFEPTIYTFNGEGILMDNQNEGGKENTPRRDAPESLYLKIDNLKELTHYRFTVEGYTTNKSLIFSNNNLLVETGEASSVDDIDFEVIGDFEIYGLNGIYVGKRLDTLSSGVYVIKSRKGNFKIVKP